MTGIRQAHLEKSSLAETRRPTDMRLLLPASSALLFVLLHLGESAGVAPLWACSYLDDLLCVPLVLTLAQLVHTLAPSAATRRADTGCPGPMPRLEPLPWVHTAMTVLVFSGIFEILLPTWSPRFSADPWDMACYAVGGVAFHLVWNRRAGS